MLMFRYYFRKNTHLFLKGQKEMIEKLRIN